MIGPGTPDLRHSLLRPLPMCRAPPKPSPSVYLKLSSPQAAAAAGLQAKLTEFLAAELDRRAAQFTESRLGRELPQRGCQALEVLSPGRRKVKLRLPRMIMMVRTRIINGNYGNSRYSKRWNSSSGQNWSFRLPFVPPA